jgi:hypothetical protein
MSIPTQPQTFSLAGTPIAKELATLAPKFPASSSPLADSSSVSGKNTSLPTLSSIKKNYGGSLTIPETDETKLHSGYLFVCPNDKANSDCKLLHALHRNPGPHAFATEIMDHIRINRNDVHLNGARLTPDEQAAVSTQLDPWGQNWIRSGDNKSLFLSGGIFNQWGYALLYFPTASWNGEQGDWDIVSLEPTHAFGPSVGTPVT